MRLLAIAGAVLLGALLIFVGAFGARWLTPDEGAGSAPVDVSALDPAVAAQNPGPSTLDRQTVGELLAVVDHKRRQQILDSSENFEKFVNQETVNQAVLKAAYANGADKNEAIRVLMERAGQRVLVDTYLNQVVRMNLDASFPSAAQVREAYEKNKELFSVQQRMHMSQIFIPLDPQDADNKAAWVLAERLSKELRAGKANFEVMAKKHSGHEASRVNDGYMGLIRVDELLPAIGAAAAQLKDGEVSDPVATETGLHILKRGAVVEKEFFDFESVKEKIRDRLKREAAFKVRQAAVQKIAAEYPVEAPRENLESWRETLRAQNPAPVAESGQSGTDG